MKKNTFGTNLKLWREKRKLSRRALSSAAGLSQAYVGMIERGAVQEVSVKVAMKLSDALGVSLRSLLAE